MRTRATEPDPARLEVYTWRVTEFRRVAKFRNVVKSDRDKFQHARTACARHAPCWRTSWRSIQLMFVTYVLYRYPLIAKNVKKKKNTYWSCRRDTQTHTLSRHFLLKKEIIKTVRVISMKDPKNSRALQISTSTRWQWKGLRSAIKVTIFPESLRYRFIGVDWNSKDVPKDARHVNVAMKSS